MELKPGKSSPMKAAAFWLTLAALVALGCASVAREESRRVYDCEGVDQDLDSLQIEAKYFSK